MKKIKKIFAHKIFKIIKWAFLILLGLFILLVFYRMIYFFNLDKTVIQVNKIHSTKLTVNDVMGKDLPPNPGIQANKTLQGVDANKNGIRDDVELAIFKKYPNSAKTRAVLLQYALVLQMEFTQPIINTKTATEIIIENSRADSCVADTMVPRKTLESNRTYKDLVKIDSYINFVEKLQFNTEARKKADEDFYNYLRSYGDSTSKICDIDVSKLPN